MPFGVHPVLHNYAKQLGTNRHSKSHQCLSAFTPFSTRRSYASARPGWPVTNAFRRSPRSPPNFENKKGWVVHHKSPMPFGVHPVLHLGQCRKGRSRDFLSPMPFGVHPVLHTMLRVFLRSLTGVTNAFRRSPRSPRPGPADTNLSVWSPMPFGVHPVLHQCARQVSSGGWIRHQCLSAFTPFSTHQFAKQPGREKRVTNAFRRSPRSPLAKLASDN